MKKLTILTALLFAGLSFLHGQDSLFNKIQVKGALFTHPSFEDITLYRIQLRLTTGRGNDAGTDQGVYVQFNPSDEQFFMSRGIDNYEEGHTDTYDILSSVVQKVKDIKFMKFGIKGSDGWCLKKVELFLNDNDFPVYTKTYAGRGQCMDNNASFTISGSELRRNSGWAYTSNHLDMWKAPAMISKDMIRSLVECSIGNQLNHRTGFGWGTKSGIDTRWGDVVEMNRVNDHTLHFDLDLQRFLNGPNPEVDIDFDLEFICDNGRIKTEMKNYSSGTNWVGEAQEFLRKKIAELVGAAIASKTGPGIGAVSTGLLFQFLDFGINIDLQHPTVSSSCSRIRIDNAGNILLR